MHLWTCCLLAERKASGRTGCALSAAYAQQPSLSDNVFDVVTYLNRLHSFKRESLSNKRRNEKGRGDVDVTWSMQ